MDNLVIIAVGILGIITVLTFLVATLRYSLTHREEEHKNTKKDREEVIALYGKYKGKFDKKTFFYDTFLVHDKKKFDFSDIEKVTYSNHCNSDHGGEDYYVQIHFKENDIPVIFIHKESLYLAIALVERIKKVSGFRH